MASIGSNPIKNPLAGNELIPAADPSNTAQDCDLTPDILTSYAQENMSLASGSTQGLVSGPNGDKLEALRSNAQINALLAQLGAVPFPIFIGTPVDGVIEIYRHVLANDVVFDFCNYALSSGSTNLTVNINGTPITGWSGLNTSNVSQQATASAAKTLKLGDILSLSFTGSALPKNLRLSLKGNLTLT
jgi:hypothetical protein